MLLIKTKMIVKNCESCCLSLFIVTCNIDLDTISIYMNIKTIQVKSSNYETIIAH